ncbi:MAG TPA: hypothetical protein VFP77_09665, partial [Gemmatimonadaceae bacterium]|nr:hypothetical protein [Gemmatimonadaceae bacterium]
MKDIQTHLEKLRVQIAECEMISHLATDHKKQELFDRLARHFTTLATELEKASSQAVDTLLGHKTHERSLKTTCKLLGIALKAAGTLGSRPRRQHS